LRLHVHAAGGTLAVSIRRRGALLKLVALNGFVALIFGIAIAISS
jgi:hypothetical protein